MERRQHAETTEGTAEIHGKTKETAKIGDTEHVAETKETCNGDYRRCSRDHRRYSGEYRGHSGNPRKDRVDR